MRFLFSNFIYIYTYMFYGIWVFVHMCAWACMHVGWSPQLMWRIISHCFPKILLIEAKSKVSQWSTDFTHRVSLSLGSPVTVTWDVNYRWNHQNQLVFVYTFWVFSYLWGKYLTLNTLRFLSLFKVKLHTSYFVLVWDMISHDPDFPHAWYIVKDDHDLLSFIHHQRAGITGIWHHAWFMWCCMWLCAIFNLGKHSSNWATASIQYTISNKQSRIVLSWFSFLHNIFQGSVCQTLFWGWNSEKWKISLSSKSLH